MTARRREVVCPYSSWVVRQLIDQECPVSSGTADSDNNSECDASSERKVRGLAH